MHAGKSNKRCVVIYCAGVCSTSCPFRADSANTGDLVRFHFVSFPFVVAKIEDVIASLSCREIFDTYLYLLFKITDLLNIDTYSLFNLLLSIWV